METTTQEPRLTLAKHSPGVGSDTWTTQARIPSNIERAIRNEKELTGESLNEIIVSRLRRSYDTAATPSHETEVTTSLEAAAYTFLSTLDDDHQRILLDNVKEYGRSLPEYIISAMKLVHDQGQTGHLMPDAAMPANLDIHASTVQHPNGHEGVELVCEECGNVIPPPYVRDGQRYCHNKDDGVPSCGRIAQLRLVKENRALQARVNNTGKAAFDLRGAIPRKRVE